MVTAAIFDIDGTLLDSVDAHAHAWQDAFADFNVQVGFDAVRSQIGKGGDQLLPVFLSQAQQAEFGDKLEQHRGKLFKSRYLGGYPPVPRGSGPVPPPAVCRGPSCARVPPRRVTSSKPTRGSPASRAWLTPPHPLPTPNAPSRIRTFSRPR